MRKNPPILAALAWMGLAAVLSAQDFFQTEGGDNIPLERNTVLSSMEVGEFHIEIQFQSTSINLNTGKFALPNYRAVYSLRPPGTDPTSQGIPWVFGQRGRWVPVQTGDFDENTGAGTAYIICPVNMSTVDGMWGITWG
ncbi:MAG: hypothetical protein ACE5H3_03320, partial [Planctomycetota bacterium]